MTSQKSLKNNVNFNDFKRSLKETMWFPIIAFVVLLSSVTFPIIQYVTSDAFVQTPVHDELQVFIESSSMGHQVFCIGMVLCGVLTALKSFYYLFSKKQVNVYLSIGVTRKTMFVNRVSSAVILLFLATFIPIFIVYLLNIANFGLTAHLTKTFLYLFFGLFISGLVGFAITTVAMMISGNIFEAALTTVSMSFIPMVLATTFDYGRMNFLKGYIDDGNVGAVWTNLFSPFTFVGDYARELNDRKDHMDYTRLSELFDVTSKYDLVDGKIPANLTIDFGLVIPLLIWFAISVLLLVCGLALINRRKAEHANSVGHFDISRAINATFAVCASICFITMAFIGEEISLTVTILATLGMSFVAYFVVQLILARKFKKTIKALRVWAVLACFTIVWFTAFYTGFFGTYNKTPEISEVKSAAISFNELSSFNNTVLSSANYVKSINEKDTKMIIDLFDEIKNDKPTDNRQGWVHFAIEDKNGETRYRLFSIYSEELYEKYLKTVFNSDYFDAVAEYKLLGFNEKHLSANGKYQASGSEDYMVNQYEDYEISDIDVSYNPDVVIRGDLYDNQMIITDTYSDMNDESVEISYSVEIRKGDDFAKAIYNDITKMTFEDLFRNNAKPYAIIGSKMIDLAFDSNKVLKPAENEWDKYDMQGFRQDYYEGYNRYYIDGEYVGTDISKFKGNFAINPIVYVYPQMTETIKYLDSKNMKFDCQYQGEIKEILYTSGPLYYHDACSFYEDKHENRFHDYFSLGARSVKTFESNYFYNGSLNGLMDCISKEETQYNLLKEIYKESGQPLSTLDSNKNSEVLEKCIPFYFVNNDNGRYVYIVYEDGSVVCQYLPKANVGVLK